MQRTFSVYRTSTLTGQKAISVLAVLAMQMSMLPAAQAQSSNAPSQNPLLSKESQVAPNVMLTLDTSWSMIFPYVPEGNLTLPGGNVIFPSFTSVVMHPKDPRHDPGDGSVNGPPKGDGGVIPGDPTSSAPLFQKQMRSPDVNKLYYDPRVRYQPWLVSKDAKNGEKRLTTDANGVKVAAPTAAAFDPLDLAKGTANLTDTTYASSGLTANWCSTPPAKAGDQKLSCPSSSKLFTPGLYYLLDGGGTCTAPYNPSNTNCYTAYDINTTPASKFTKYKDRTDCAANPCTREEERQNFANWFVFYRTRLHTAQAAIPEAFLQVDDSKIRLGLATIHKGTSQIGGVDTSNVFDGIALMDSMRKTTMVDWLRGIKSDTAIPAGTAAENRLQGRTPLLTALKGVGEYFKRKDIHGPWASNPKDGDTSQTAALACRRSYNVLITDGYYTDTSTVGNVDGTSDDPQVAANHITSPDNKDFVYTARAPYQDACASTLADVAMYYWKTDLRDDLSNIVPYGTDTVGQDPAFWQHLVQFPIGLGVEGNQPYTDLAKVVKNNSDKNTAWWSGSCSVGGSDPRLIDDLFHAAVNSRGQYFSVKTPGELTKALSSALSRVGRREGQKQAGVALASTSVSGTNVKYVPEYTTVQWIGDIKAYDTDDKGNWLSTPKWSAVDRLPAPLSRNIVTWNGTKGVAFSASATDADLADAKAKLAESLPEGATTDELLSYINGDQSKEDTAQTTQLFRQRESLLGDFVNTTPTLVKNGVNLGYEQLPGTAGANYLNFITKTKPARGAVLFAGANDGMLHAFADYEIANAKPPLKNGQEIFAYVVRAGLSKLGKFAQRDYGTSTNPHQFFADGPLTESDAFLGNPPDASWQNVLIGTMGAGGRAIYAINVTQSNQLGPTSVMWEKSSDDNGDFGYMMGAAQVGVLPDGTWKVFVGNGPYSDKQRAALMVIDLASGEVTSIPVSATDSGNGLGAVRLRKNSKQQVEAIYAGDLKGNLWRFDVTGTSSSSVSTTPTLLFAGLSTQPITAAPAVVPHPSGGYMVVAGTGKLINDTDTDDTVQQAVYGIWDKPAASAPVLADLVEQVIVKDAVASTSSHTYYKVQFNTVKYETKRGWYIKLDQMAGQRLIYAISAIRDFVLVPTIKPAQTQQEESCKQSEGEGVTFLLPALMDGTYDNTPILDTNADGLVNGNDKIASGFSVKADGPGATGTENKDDGSVSLRDTHTDTHQDALIPPGKSKIISRIWRQLVSPPQP